MTLLGTDQDVFWRALGSGGANAAETGYLQTGTV